MIHTSKSRLIMELQRIVKEECHQELLHPDRLHTEDIKLLIQALLNKGNNYNTTIVDIGELYLKDRVGNG